MEPVRWSVARAAALAVTAILLLAACGDTEGAPTVAPTAMPTATAAITPSTTPSASSSPAPTATPAPPTATPAPTPTPTAPPPTPTPAPELPGATWSDAREPAVPAGRPAGQLESVTAWSGGFVAVGRGCEFRGTDSCEAIVWTTDTGRRWTRAPRQDALDTGFAIPMSGPEVGMFDVAAGTPGIVAIGYAARPDMRAAAWFSRDGVTWSRRWIGVPYTSRVNAVAWTGDRFVIVGEDRSDLEDWRDLPTATARAAVWTSTDGLAWTRVRHTRSLNAGGFVDTMEDPITGGMRDVVAGPDGLVAVGSTCRASSGTCRAAAWVSTTGLRWTRVRDIPPTGGVLKAVALGGEEGSTRFVAVGRRSCGNRAPIESNDCTALVLTSPDGRTWTRQAFPQGGDVRTVTWVGDRFFGTAPDGPVSARTSPDGVAWVPAVVSGGPSVQTGTEYAAWHIAATSRRAVWVGTPPEARSPEAWVSVASR